MANIVSIPTPVPPPSGVKNVQRGTHHVGGQITIPIIPVNIDKSYLVFSYTLHGEFIGFHAIPSGHISTTSTIVFNNAPGHAAQVQWQVIEYW